MTSGAINETEQAGEKLTDHAIPHVIEIIHAVFACIWRTRIVIEIQERQ